MSSAATSYADAGIARATLTEIRGHDTRAPDDISGGLA
jgi:hypothetical protein